jgi:DNA-binding CsgD family transcriptional regulator
MLRERESALMALDGCLADASDGQGRMVLLAGEAGVGKTSVVHEFWRRHQGHAQLLWGACDALATPSPLGPLYDMAEAGGDVAALMAGDLSQPERFRGFLAAVTVRAAPGRPVVVVFEDVQWADQATLDLLVFLGRRIDAVRALVVVTYRDDELRADHPLRTVLGRLTASQVRRVRLECLSPKAVAEMVDELATDTAADGVTGRSLDPARVHDVTGGNPFFVTELLAAPPGAVPETVRDAVLTRMAQLSAPARAVLQLVAVAPDRVEVSLVTEVTGGSAPAAVRECEQAGVVRLSGRTVAFRHELARQAVEQAIPAVERPDLHAAVLAHLVGQPTPDPAKLAYHASRAEDQKAVLRYAPVAAERATRLGAHREALDHFRDALRYAEALPAAERVQLLEKYAGQCSATGRHDEGGRALDQVVALRRELGDVDGCARAMARRAHFLYMTAPAKEAYEQVAEATALVEGRPPSLALAAVYGDAAFLHSQAQDRERTLATGNRAVALAEKFGAYEALTNALVALGCVQWWTDPARAEATMARAVEAAHRSDRAASVVTAAGFLGATALGARRYRTADHWLGEVVDWCVEHDLDAPRDFYRACQATSHFEQGRWAQAAELVSALTATDAGTYPPARRNARRLQGHLAVRRGDPDQAAPLAEAWQWASGTGDPIRQWAVVAVRAEAAWHSGRAAQIPELIRDTYAGVVAQGHPWAMGELAFWLWRAGALERPPESAAEPYVLHIGGEFGAAAAAWDAIGCPYEAAEARADTGDPDEMRAALESFYSLGARPAANRLVHRLRKLGVTGLPRRPHRSTSANPVGLTDRELEIATLLASGLSNAEIAARLHISLRTTGHHVGAIAGKLGVTRRRDAVEAAQRLGIGPRTGT